MDLNEYLFKNNIKQNEFAKIIGTHPVNLVKLKKKVGSPNLFLAIKIVEYSKGEISFFDLLSTPDKKQILDWFNEIILLDSADHLKNNKDEECNVEDILKAKEKMYDRIK